MFPTEKEDHDLYYHKLTNLKFNAEYNVGVRGINTEFPRLESTAIWMTFKTPSCKELHSNSTICVFNPIVNLTAEFTFIEGNKFDVLIAWNHSNYEPALYTLEIRDVNLRKNANGLVEPYTYSIKVN